MKTRRPAFTSFLRRRGHFLFWALLATLLVAGMLAFRIGTIVPGLSPMEHVTAQTTYGWHGLYAHPLDLPLNAVRSVTLKLVNHPTVTLLRLPSALFGAVTILAFAILIKYWHGNRTALLATALFATSAWVLHVSRLASNDILYLLAIPALLFIQLVMLRASTKAIVFYGSLAACGILLYVPGLVWLVLLSLFWQRRAISVGWKHFGRIWQRGLYVLTGLIWLPLLGYRLMHLDQFKLWLGLPSHIAVAQIGRQLAFVPVHLLVRGPRDPERWMGHAPILDAFALAVVIAGICFYVAHFRATRSRILASYGLLGLILVGLGGSVSLSLLVPLLYILAATGIAYLLHEWLRVFPVNPIARKLGIGLVAIAVIASCGYNLRAYFVAWPHDRTTQVTFTTKP